MLYTDDVTCYNRYDNYCCDMADVIAIVADVIATVFDYIVVDVITKLYWLMVLPSM